MRVTRQVFDVRKYKYLKPKIVCANSCVHYDLYMIEIFSRWSIIEILHLKDYTKNQLTLVFEGKELHHEYCPYR
jgi:hypothetical protein